MNPDTSSQNDNLDESLWDSPGKTHGTPQNSARSTYHNQEEHDTLLRQELQNVREVNEAIEGVVQSLRKAKDNIKTVNNTVSAASTLLNTWTRILSQTEHNQRLILDPTWHGATQDIADIEGEALEKHRATERREVEEEERKRAATRRAEEEERKRAEAAATKPTKVTSRGTGRAASAGQGSVASTPSSSYVRMGGSSGVKRGTSTTRRTTPGIGRGVVGRSGRGHG